MERAGAVKIDEAVFTFIDVETTGLSPRSARVCEVAAVSFCNGERLGTLAELVNPGCPIPPECTRVHGITDDMVSKAPPFGEVAPRLLAMLENSFVVAHNASFDRSFLEMECRRVGLRFPVTDDRVCDTLKLARGWKPKFQSNRLGNIAAELRIPAENWHRALSDVEMTQKIFSHFVVKLKSEGAVFVHEIGKRK